jgi:5-methylthioribose kinase
MFDSRLTNPELIRLKRARDIQDVGRMAVEVARRMTSGQHGVLVLVCGPLFTGSRQSVDENTRIIARAVSLLKQTGVMVFDHLFFLRQIWKLAQADGTSREEIDREVMRKYFYLPLLESGCVGKIFFTGHWQKSQGARWWYQEAKNRGIEIEVAFVRRVREVREENVLI